jgi:hypothetical protein
MKTCVAPVLIALALALSASYLAAEVPPPGDHPMELFGRSGRISLVAGPVSENTTGKGQGSADADGAEVEHRLVFKEANREDVVVKAWRSARNLAAGGDQRIEAVRSISPTKVLVVVRDIGLRAILFEMIGGKVSEISDEKPFFRPPVSIALLYKMQLVDVSSTDTRVTLRFDAYDPANRSNSIRYTAVGALATDGKWYFDTIDWRPTHANEGERD